MHLTREDLKKLEGTWELKVNPVNGWKGTVKAIIKLRPEKSNWPSSKGILEDGVLKLYPDNGRWLNDRAQIFYDYDLTRGTDRFRVVDLTEPYTEFHGAGTSKFQGMIAFPTLESEEEAKESKREHTAIYELKGDTLTVDFAKNLRDFVPRYVRAMNVDWSKAVWQRVKSK